jgi:hypothetical protein
VRGRLRAPRPPSKMQLAIWAGRAPARIAVEWAMPNTPTDGGDVERAVRAKEAGVVLAQMIGIPEPIKAARVFQLVRLGVLPAIHVGRRVWVQVSALRQFVAKGGCAYAERDLSAPRSRGGAQ